MFYDMHADTTGSLNSRKMLAARRDPNSEQGTFTLSTLQFAHSSMSVSVGSIYMSENVDASAVTSRLNPGCDPASTTPGFLAMQTESHDDSSEGPEAVPGLLVAV